MPKYVIERDLPNVGNSSKDQLQEMALSSCDVLRNMGPEIQWVHSYVTDNKIYCVYNAPNEEMIKQHAREAGFPSDTISRVRAIIDPVTAEKEIAMV